MIDRIKATSMEHFGFYSKRPSRMREYSWILKQLQKIGRACDIGAGTSAVPIILAEDGWSVDTVDYWDAATGDEWGFVNYGLINDNIRSWNCDFSNYEVDCTYSAIYSVSALEHTYADNRFMIFRKAYNLLDEGGILCITIDIQQRTDLIHNRNHGKAIEENHGTIGDILYELDEFSCIQYNVEEFIGQGQDVLFIKAIK